MRLIPTRYFSEDDLKPLAQIRETPNSLLPNHIIEKIWTITRELHETSYADLSETQVNENPEVALYIAFLHLFGAITVNLRGGEYNLSISGSLASDLPYVIALYLEHGFSFFDDWSRRYRTLPDQMSALDFLHNIELNRIKCSRETGHFPEITRKVPVAFAIIKAYSRKRRKDVYLFELNKDWNRYNLIGGKQQCKDRDDYVETCLREMEEELGVSRDGIFLTPLTSEPLKGYSLSGSRGALSYYPCMLYWARIKGPFSIRQKDVWLSELEILQFQRSDDPGLMINHVYLDFIFRKLKDGLAGLDYSLDKPIEEDRWFYRARDFIIEHKIWLIPLLAIIAGIIKIISTLLK